MEAKFKKIDISKVNEHLDFIIKTSTFLFFLLSFVGFSLLIAYLKKYGLAYESISYISSLNYLFSMAFLALIISASLALCFSFLPYWIGKTNRLEKGKWISEHNLKGKNRELYIMVFVNTVIACFSFVLIYFFDDKYLYLSLFLYFLLPLFYASTVVFRRYKSFKCNRKSNEWIKDIINLYFCCTPLLVVNFYILLTALLILKNVTDEWYLSIFTLILYWLLLTLCYLPCKDKEDKEDKEGKNLIIKSIVLFITASSFIFGYYVLFPDQIMKDIGIGGFSSNYIIDNKYDYICSDINCEKYKKSENYLIKDIWVIAILPKKIIFTKSEPEMDKKFTIYSLPRDSILSRVILRESR